MEAAMGSQEPEVLESTPPEDWMVEERLAAKRAEEKMAAAGCDGVMVAAKRPKAARQIAVAEAGAAVEGEAKPAAVGKKKKLVRVRQGYIDWLLSNPHTHKPYRPMPQELIDRVQPPEKREEFRALMASATATQQKMRNRHAKLLEQYRLKGYAEEEIEVSADEEEDEAVCN